MSETHPTSDATIDLARADRCGFPEVVYGPGKRPETVAEIFAVQQSHGQACLATRVDADQTEAVRNRFPQAIANEIARTIRLPAPVGNALRGVPPETSARVAGSKPEGRGPEGVASDEDEPDRTPLVRGHGHSPLDPATLASETSAERHGGRSLQDGTQTGFVAVLTAGTTDRPVAEEAVETLRWMNVGVELIMDIGVAGPQRLLDAKPRFVHADAIVVAAGMEGALPSVVGGHVACPVIAVPTSVGYGAAFGGIAALLGMLNSCASNVTVVNIDAGFKAGYVAGLIARRMEK
ncbi:MAG: nickel pincer cofactor biosynthesis protein LarB [Planctomycetaceae bacterium]